MPVNAWSVGFNWMPRLSASWRAARGVGIQDVLHDNIAFREQPVNEARRHDERIRLGACSAARGRRPIARSQVVGARHFGRGGPSQDVGPDSRAERALVGAGRRGRQRRGARAARLLPPSRAARPRRLRVGRSRRRLELVGGQRLEQPAEARLSSIMKPPSTRTQLSAAAVARTRSPWRRRPTTVAEASGASRTKTSA